MCCSVLQSAHCNRHAAAHCNTLQHTATHCNILQHTATHCNTLQHTATHCSTLQHTATHCSTLPHTAIHRERFTLLKDMVQPLQLTATHCSSLELTTTHCNSWQHTESDAWHSRIWCSCAQQSSRMAHCNTLQHTANSPQHTATHRERRTALKDMVQPLVAELNNGWVFRLGCRFPATKSCAARALGQLANGSAENVEAMVKAGAVQVLPLQHTATYFWNTLQHTPAAHCNALAALHNTSATNVCNTLHTTATHFCNTLHTTATHLRPWSRQARCRHYFCNTLQRISATHFLPLPTLCNTRLQHTSYHCNTLEAMVKTGAVTVL